MDSYSEYYKSLSGDVSQRYLQKINICEGIDPYTLKGQITNAKDYPEVEYNDLYNYLVYTTSFYTQDEMRAYKSLLSYKFFLNGWVKNLYCKKIANSKKIVRGQVTKSA